MKYMEELRYKPVALFRCDDTTPLQDYSGYNRSGLVEGTASTGLCVSADATYSQRFSNDGSGKFSAPVYQQGQEEKDFSLSVCVYPIIIGSGSHQQILSHGGVYDGITIEGTTVHFSTSYVGADMARCSYDFEFARRLHIVGVHQKSKNSLYVNGVLVDEVDITAAQQEAQFGLAEAAFYAGANVGNTQKCLMNNVAIYSHALQSEAINAIYRSVSKTAEGNVPAMFDGVEVLIDSSVRPAAIEKSWDNEEDWQAGYQYGTAVDGDSVVANMSNGLTLSSSWIDSVDLYSGTVPLPITSAQLWWEGKNEAVQVSIDGFNWVAAVRGQNLSIIPANFDPTDKALYVKVSFASGLDEAFIDSLSFKAYTSTTTNSNNRIVTYGNPSTVFDYGNAFDMRDDWGVLLDYSKLTISPEQSSVPLNPMTIEIWFKVLSSDTPSLLLEGRSSGDTTTGRPIVNIQYDPVAAPVWTSANATRYLDGNLVGGSAPAPTVGEWHVAHITFTTPQDTVFFVNGRQTTGSSAKMQIGKIAVYSTTMTGTEIRKVVDSYTGVSKIRQDLTGTVTVTEPSASTVIYAADWEIAAS